MQETSLIMAALLVYIVFAGFSVLVNGGGTMEETFFDVKVGDRLAAKDSLGWREIVVDKVQAGKFYANGTAFYMANGVAVSADWWSQARHITASVEDALTAARLEVERKMLAAEMTIVRWFSLPLVTLQKIAKLIPSDARGDHAELL